MTTLLQGLHRVAACMLLVGIAAAAVPTARADIYDDAVNHAGRSPADVQRDALDHPAELLRLAKIKPGMRVADVLASSGYYSELLSYIVGPKGHVLLLNNAAYDTWDNKSWEKRLANKRLPNVEARTIDLEHLAIPDASLDAMLLIKVYHDFYWTDPEGTWPKMDPNKVLTEVARVLKPGGTLLLVDHSAKPGTGSADAQTLHRIEEAYTRADFAKHGLVVVANSDVLRRPDDPRDQITYKGTMVGKTDRFVLVLRRRG